MKKKYYVVFSGKKPGIYETWNECQEQTKGQSGAKFKSYKTYEEAKEEYEKHQKESVISDEDYNNSVSVDASCLGNPGAMEYRMVHTKTGEVVFNSEVFPLGTNNIGEFLALVSAMKYLSDREMTDKIIFIDSITAMAWVRNKKMKTTLERTEQTEKLYQKLDKAIEWLEEEDISKYKIVKWETHIHGDIKADFGRK